jgi:hypothetical protein
MSLYDRLAPLAAQVAQKRATHQRAVARIRARVARVQQRCPHAQTQHNPDPCHTDSFTRCLDCGAERLGTAGEWQTCPEILG